MCGKSVDLGTVAKEEFDKLRVATVRSAKDGSAGGQLYLPRHSQRTVGTDRDDKR
jgi:hypothetical protein